MPRELIPFIDLTRLEEDNPGEFAKITELAEKALKYKVAAVCVYPRYLPIVQKILQGSGIHLATVINFPEGKDPFDVVMQDTKKAIDAGADEIDLVFPYHAYLQGNDVLAFVSECKKICGNRLLKVILETGAIPLDVLPRMAREVIGADADFLKTSTGKISVGATVLAVKILLNAIKESGRDVGIKVSGGVRTVEEAVCYAELMKEILGNEALMPNRFRIGASSLLDKLIEQV